MFIPILFGEDAYTPAEIYTVSNRRFVYTKTPLIPFPIFEKYLTAFGADFAKGMNSGAILNDFKNRQAAITGGAYIASTSQLASLVSSLYDIASATGAGKPIESAIQSPYDSPSWTEVFSDAGKSIAGKYLLWGLGALLLYDLSKSYLIKKVTR